MTEPAPPPPPLQAADIRRRRLIFRATHRGSHENDLLLGGYVRRHIDDMPDGEMDALEEVMELPDADLADWLTGRRPIPPEVDSPLLRAIRAFALEKRPENRT